MLGAERRPPYFAHALCDRYDGFSFEILDCRGIDLPNAEEPWEEACPPAHVQLRAGVPAPPRYAPALQGVLGVVDRPCICDASRDHIRCQ